MKVLIVRIGAMGDVLHAIPAVAALRRARPAWRIDWVVDERWVDLLVAPGTSSGPVVDGVFVVRTRDWNRGPFSRATARDVFGLRRRLRAEGYDLCVDLQGTMRSAVIGWLAGSVRYVGPEEPREGPAMRLYGEKVRASAVHVIDQAGEIVSSGAGERLQVGDGPVPLGVAEELWADGAAGDVGGDRGFVVIAPTSGWRSKEWPAERFGELARRLGEAGFGVAVNATGVAGGVNEVAEVVVQASGGWGVAVPCSIGQLAALLRRARLFVGGDTGPLHLADALGVPVVALFGPTDPARTGPVGVRSQMLRHKSSVTDHRRHRVVEAGLAKITVDEVMEAATGLLMAEFDKGD